MFLGAGKLSFAVLGRLDELESSRRMAVTFKTFKSAEVIESLHANVCTIEATNLSKVFWSFRVASLSQNPPRLMVTSRVD